MLLKSHYLFPVTGNQLLRVESKRTVVTFAQPPLLASFRYQVFCVLLYIPIVSVLFPFQSPTTGIQLASTDPKRTV